MNDVLPLIFEPVMILISSLQLKLLVIHFDSDNNGWAISLISSFISLDIIGNVTLSFINGIVVKLIRFSSSVMLIVLVLKISLFIVISFLYFTLFV